MSNEIEDSYIVQVLQEIVNTEHTDPRKRKVFYNKSGNVLASIACPYCQDSSKNAYNYRGNINRNLFFKCFNCEKQTHFLGLCKDFKIQIDPDKRMILNQNLSESKKATSNSSNDYISAKLDKLLSLDDLTRIFNSGDEIITDFKPVQPGSTIERYLIKRKIFNDSNIYQATYWKGSDWKEPIICILNKRDDKVLGMQIRNIKDGKLRFFKIYNYESLHKWIGSEHLSLEEYYSYNKLSYYFNVLNVNFDTTITLFEGYIDSIFYPNSIGVTGVNTDLSFFENNDLDIQYFFDNDDSGYKKSDEKIKLGYKVFLWNKMFESIVEKKVTDDPHSLLHRISKIKDLNKLSQIVENPYITLNLKGFFSRDIFDIKWIPKVKKYIRKV